MAIFSYQDKNADQFDGISDELRVLFNDFLDFALFEVLALVLLNMQNDLRPSRQLWIVDMTNNKGTYKSQLFDSKANPFIISLPKYVTDSVHCSG